MKKEEKRKKEELKEALKEGRISTTFYETQWKNITQYYKKPLN